MAANPGSAEGKLLDAETIARAEMLGLQARSIVEGYMAGAHKSPYRGFAMEFAQHREYVPGDDIRHLDWKVLARSDRFSIKQYEQETNYVAHLLVDGSKSMAYGSGEVTKFDYARKLAACLAYLILLQRDAMSLAIFDSAVRRHLPRTDNLGSIHEMLLALAGFVPGMESSIGSVLHEVAQQVKRRGIVIAISDFFDDETAVLDGIQHLRFGGSEVIVFHVLDPYELRFPFTGSVEFWNLESPERIRTRPSEIRKSYLDEVNRFIDRIREGCVRAGCNYILVDTAQPLSEVLSGYLATRQHHYG